MRATRAVARDDRFWHDLRTVDAVDLLHAAPGVRLTALSGIRNTGRAILVNSQPLTPPYVVEAIGDNATLQARLLESSQGRAWFGLVNGLGFGYEAENVNMVRLPASTLRTLRDVTEGTSGNPSKTEEEVTP